MPMCIFLRCMVHQKTHDGRYGAAVCLLVDRTNSVISNVSHEVMGAVELRNLIFFNFMFRQ